MRQTTARLLFCLALLLTAAPGPAFAASGERTLTGEYRSGFGDGPLEAVFTAAGENRWEVDFHFSHAGRDLTYSGEAQGSLDRGGLRGRVETADGSRTFTFRGEFEDGTFRGTHAEVYRNRERRTGTLTLAE